MTALRLVHSVPTPAHPASPWRFTLRDLMALNAWIAQSDNHGYRRLVVERGEAGEEPEHGSFALLSARVGDGAIWGLAREGGHVTVWRCSTGADVGRFDGMRQALEALPHADGLSSRSREPIPHGRTAFCF